MLGKIEELNKTIEKLMVEKTKADAQKEVWEGKLKEGLKDYKEKYGVDLSGKTFSDIKNNLAKEIKEVENQTKKEYEQAQQVVSLIQSGDIKGAWKLLGVDIDAQEKADEVVEEVVEETKLDKQQEELQGVSSVVSEIEGLDDSDFLGEGSEDAELQDGDFFVEEDDEEEPATLEPTEEEKAISEEVDKVLDSPKFGGISFDDDDDDDFVTQETEDKSSGTIEMEDDDEDDFGGFGKILKGSKFEI